MAAAWRLQPARRVVRDGGVIAYPTEAVWGLGCDPFNAAAVAALLRMKHRPSAKGLIVVAADIGQFGAWLEDVDPSGLERLGATWPGPVTWLVPAGRSVPRWITGRHATVALRVSAHPVVQSLCRAVGKPLVSTSANPSGLSPAMNSMKVRTYFGADVGAIVEGRLGGAAAPSQIRDLASGEVLRG